MLMKKKIAKIQEGIATETVLAGKKMSGLAGSTLKIIALAAMFLDHYAWAVIDGILVKANVATFPSFALPSASASLLILWVFSILFHLLGRITIPLMLFFISEGLTYTQNVYKYGARFLLFAIISEIPFDLAFYGKVFYPNAQNVFFTLFLSFAAMYSIRKYGGEKPLAAVATVAFCLAAAYLIKCDYSYRGVLAGCVIELLREKKTRAYFGGAAVLTASRLCELTTFLALPLVYFYNGKRGMKLKFLFWIFYPAHLLLLFALKRVI